LDEQKVTQWTRERLIGGHKDGGVSAVSKCERYQRALTARDKWPRNDQV